MIQRIAEELVNDYNIKQPSSPPEVHLPPEIFDRLFLEFRNDLVPQHLKRWNTPLTGEWLEIQSYIGPIRIKRKYNVKPVSNLSR